MWPQEPNRVEGRTIVVVLSTLTLLLALSVVLSGLLLVHWQGSLVGREVPLHASPTGEPPSDLYVEAEPEAVSPEALGAWQWVDRDREILAIPIELAMDRVIEANR